MRSLRATTRLAWLVNMDFAGFIPAAFSAAALVGLCAYPVDVVERTRDFVEQRRGSSSTAASLGFGLEDGDVGGGDESAAPTASFTVERGRSTSALLQANTELKAQSDRDASKIGALKSRIDLLEGKVSRVPALEEEISTLRRRLARRDSGGGSEERGGESGET